MTITNISKCTGCSACQKSCVKNCITMAYDKEGFLYPIINETICINCGLCTKVCPVNKEKLSSNILSTYGITNKNEDIRKSSSSGGIFYTLAEYVISKGGVVYGVAFENDFKSVKHIGIEKLEDIALLQGSKYMQSTINDTYINCKNNLLNNKPVLFSGTPCQIAGLKTFLNKDYDNLYTIDVVCHGAPSQKVWKEYLQLKEKQFGSKAINVNFRNKKNGWKGFCVIINFENGKIYENDFFNEPFMKGFLSNLYLRPSCYNCAFKGTNRYSDLILADFWGIQTCYPDLDDNLGTSLVLCRTEKGEHLLNAVKDNLNIAQVNYEIAIKGNPSFSESSQLTENRQIFFNDFYTKKINKVFNKHCSDKFIVRSKKFIKKILSKLKIKY